MPKKVNMKKLRERAKEERMLNAKFQAEQDEIVKEEEIDGELMDEDYEDYAKFMSSEFDTKSLGKQLTLRERREQAKLEKKARRKERRQNEDKANEEEEEEGEMPVEDGEGEEQEEQEFQPRKQTLSELHRRQHRPEMSIPKPAAPLSELASAAERQQRVRHQREVIARLSTKIMDHAASIDMFKPLGMLHALCFDQDLVVRNLAVLSEAAVWKDVLPDYQIFKRENETTVDTKGNVRAVTLSKQVLEKRSYENAIVTHYENFLSFCQRSFKEISLALSSPAKYAARSRAWKAKEKAKEAKSGKAGKADEWAALAAAAGSGDAKKLEEAELVTVRAVCTLLEAKPYFNFRENLLEMVVPKLASPRRRVFMEVAGAIRKVIKGDVSGVITLDIVRRVGKLLKGLGYRCAPEALEPFLSIELEKDLIINPFAAMEGRTRGDEGAGAAEGKRRGKDEYVSKKQKKLDKAEKIIAKEFRESEAEYTKEELRKTHTAILDSMFGTYFRILKRAPQSPLLPVVLTGIAKYTNQINVDFMGDIVRAIEALMHNPDVPRHITFYCARTVLLALRTQGFYTDVDLTDFFSGVYAALFDLVLAADRTPAANSASNSVSADALAAAAAAAGGQEGGDEVNGNIGNGESDVEIVALEALELLLCENKQVPIDRLAAFVKRIATVLLMCTSHSAISLAALAVIAVCVRRHPKLYNLVGSEQGIGSTGQYIADLQEPDHCNPWATALWELPFLQAENHYNTHYAKVVAQFLANSDPMILRAKSPRDLALVLKRDSLCCGILPAADADPEALKMKSEPKFPYPVEVEFDNESNAMEEEEEEKSGFNGFAKDMFVRHAVVSIDSRIQSLKRTIEDRENEEKKKQQQQPSKSDEKMQPKKKKAKK